MTTTTSTRKREPRTKELCLKQQVQNYISENPEVSKKQVAAHFNISSKELSIILGKLPNVKIK